MKVYGGVYGLVRVLGAWPRLRAYRVNGLGFRGFREVLSSSCRMVSGLTTRFRV